MKEYAKCTINGVENYLNDVLVDLIYCEQPFIFEFEGKRFKAYPDNAKEFCMDYSRDIYAQNVSSINDTMEGLMAFIYQTGDIIRQLD